MQYRLVKAYFHLIVEIMSMDGCKILGALLNHQYSYDLMKRTMRCKSYLLFFSFINFDFLVVIATPSV